MSGRFISRLLVMLPPAVPKGDMEKIMLIRGETSVSR